MSADSSAKEDGLVHGDEFVFEAGKIPSLLREVAALLTRKKIVGKNADETPVAARVQSEEFTAKNLEALATAVETKK